MFSPSGTRTAVATRHPGNFTTGVKDAKANLAIVLRGFVQDGARALLQQQARMREHQERQAHKRMEAEKKKKRKRGRKTAAKK
jgi:hypothetical protein